MICQYHDPAWYDDFWEKGMVTQEVRYQQQFTEVSLWLLSDSVAYKMEGRIYCMVYVLTNYGVGFVYTDGGGENHKMGLMIKDEELPVDAKYSPNMMQEDIGRAVDNIVQYIAVLGERYKQWKLHRDGLGHLWFFSHQIDWNKYLSDKGKDAAVRDAMKQQDIYIVPKDFVMKALCSNADLRSKFSRPLQEMKYNYSYE